jgi:peroxiredoxin
MEILKRPTPTNTLTGAVMSLRTSLSLTALLAGGLVIAYNWSTRSGTPVTVEAEKNRKAAPDFALKDIKGADVTLSDYKGKVVLLNFWATWCGPCKIEIPWFSEFQEKYRVRDFAVIGVSMDEDGWDAVKPYVEGKKMNYRVVIGNDALSQLFGGVESLPTTLLIDRDGKIAARHTGLVSKSNYEGEILALLRK